MPFIEYQGEQIEYSIERKRVKRVNLRITREGEVKVSAPRSVSKRFIQAFVEEKGPWIYQCLQRQGQCRKLNKAQINAEQGSIVWWLGNPYTLIFEKGQNGLHFSEGNCVWTFREIPQQKKLESELRSAYLELCQLRLQTVYERFQPFHLPFPKLKLRKMKRCWGTCQPTTAVITLNSKLMHAPVVCTDYILAHELTHFVEPNHGDGFYRVLQAVYPQWKAQKALLAEQYIL